MHRLIVACALALAACDAPEPAAPTPTGQMSAIALFDPARFAGSWHEVASLGRAPGPNWRVTTGPGGALHVTRGGASGHGKMTGPGRLSLSHIDAPLWVLWVDADYRTLVLGTPDRSFAYVLDRGATSSPDRLRAAREILAWNGYDAAKLKR